MMLCEGGGRRELGAGHFERDNFIGLTWPSGFKDKYVCIIPGYILLLITKNYALVRFAIELRTHSKFGVGWQSYRRRRLSVYSSVQHVYGVFVCWKSGTLNELISVGCCLLIIN